MKILLLLTVTSLSLVFADEFHTPEKINCEVKEITPEHANFFSFVRTPTVGDKITFDLTKSEITELRFDSGASIPIKEANAKFVKLPTQWAGQSYYQGTHTSSTSHYTGVMNFYHSPQGSSLSLQIVQNRRLRGLTLHQLQAECQNAQ